MSKVPLKPSKKETMLSWMYTVLCAFLWVALIFCGIQVIIYYITQIVIKGYLDQESIKYATYILIGTFFVLFVHRDQAKNIFKIKDKEQFSQMRKHK
jgi:hypothetical protein